MTRAEALSGEPGDWAATGRHEQVLGRSIWVRADGAGGDPAVLLLHGFPSSSFDFRHLLPLLGGHATLTFDFLGFGLSEKPRDHTYSLMWQADLADELVARHLAGRPIFLVAHDMGTSVATELLARDLERRLGFELAGVLLFNGSIVLERASLTAIQRLLRSPAGALVSRLASERVFRRQFGRLFSGAHPLTDAEAEAQWSLIRRGGGRSLGHRLIHYLDERERHAERWHGAIRNWPGPLSFAWGLEDPVATVAVLDALRELRPHAPVTELPGLGHYPQLEDPERVAAAVREAASLTLPGIR